MRSHCLGPSHLIINLCLMCPCLCSVQVVLMAQRDQKEALGHSPNDSIRTNCGQQWPSSPFYCTSHTLCAGLLFWRLKMADSSGQRRGDSAFKFKLRSHVDIRVGRCTASRNNSSHYHTRLCSWCHNKSTCYAEVVNINLHVAILPIIKGQLVTQLLG